MLVTALVVPMLARDRRMEIDNDPVVIIPPLPRARTTSRLRQWMGEYDA